MKRLSFSFLAVLALPLVGAACSSQSDDIDATEDGVKTSYGDFASILEGADYDRWIAVKKQLQTGFDNICGDTFCSGDYSNLTTLRLQCSATTVAKKMKDCAWVLGGAITYVNPATGATSVDDRTFDCKIPVAGTAKTFLNTLSAAGDKALRVTLPGTKGSFYDGIANCLSGVVGDLPPAEVPGPFLSMEDYFNNGGAGDGEAWDGIRWGLGTAFDQVCGDTFCEGDYSDIASIKFSCAVDTKANKVRSCNWTFGFANTSVNSKGLLDIDSGTQTCSVKLYANPTTLINALKADPLNAHLPGKTTSLYDSLIDCLP